MTARSLQAGLAVAIVLLSVAPVLAISGTVVDPQGKALGGASVCYLSADVELLCVETDEAGYYELPDSELDRIRLSLAGFLPRVLAAVEHEAPIALEPSATLLVRLQDATDGKALGAGEIYVFAPTGRRLGPFPTNVSGVRVRSLRPGTVRISAEVAGYEPLRDHAAELVGGEETEVVVKMTRDSSD